MLDFHCLPQPFQRHSCLSILRLKAQNRLTIAERGHRIAFDILMRLHAPIVRLHTILIQADGNRTVFDTFQETIQFQIAMRPIREINRIEFVQTNRLRVVMDGLLELTVFHAIVATRFEFVGFVQCRWYFHNGRRCCWLV